MNKDKIRKRVEPFLHLLAFANAIFLGTSGVIGGFYNPMPYQSYCSVAPFPFWCSGTGVLGSVQAGENGSLTEFNECTQIVGNQSFQSVVTLILLMLGALNIFALVVSMCCVFFTVYRQHRLLKYYLNNIYSQRIKRRRELQTRGIEEEDRLREEAENNLKYTKVSMVQAMAYVLACAAVQVFPILNFAASREAKLWNSSFYSLLLMIVFPLQGLFNFIIFVSHKMFNLKVAYPNLSRWERFVKVLTVPDEPIVLLSNVSIVSDRNNSDGLDFLEEVDHSQSNEEGISYQDDNVDSFEDNSNVINAMNNENSLVASSFLSQSINTNNVSHVASSIEG